MLIFLRMLDKLFTSKARIKILGYLFFKKKETYLRETAKELNLSPSAVKREFDNLAEIDIIKKQKNKIILNESNPFFEELKQIFLKTDFIAYPIKEALTKKDIEFALIFGSFAKGNFNSESDLDLLIIGKISLSEAIKLLNPAEKIIGRNINTIIWNLHEFEERKKGKFAYEIFSGKILMIKGDENELRKIARE